MRAYTPCQIRFAEQNYVSKKKYTFVEISKNDDLSKANPVFAEIPSHPN